VAFGVIFSLSEKHLFLLMTQGKKTATLLNRYGAFRRVLAVRLHRSYLVKKKNKRILRKKAVLSSPVAFFGDSFSIYNTNKRESIFL
jgi:hypothetical protein